MIRYYTIIDGPSFKLGELVPMAFYNTDGYQKN